MALPVTAPSAAGFLLTVLTEKPSHPVTSTSTTWQSPNLQQGGAGACQLAGIWSGAADEWRTHAVSETISPRTPGKPRAPAATAAAAMVFTLLGARGHSSATDPLNKTRRPSPSFQSERASPVSRKQDGCLDILINTPWKHRSGSQKGTTRDCYRRHICIVTFNFPLSFILCMSWPPHNAPLGT